MGMFISQGRVAVKFSEDVCGLLAKNVDTHANKLSLGLRSEIFKGVRKDETGLGQSWTPFCVQGSQEIWKIRPVLFKASAWSFTHRE